MQIIDKEIEQLQQEKFEQDETEDLISFISCKEIINPVIRKEIFKLKIKTLNLKNLVLNLEEKYFYLLDNLNSIKKMVSNMKISKNLPTSENKNFSQEKNNQFEFPKNQNTKKNGKKIIKDSQKRKSPKKNKIKKNLDSDAIFPKYEIIDKNKIYLKNIKIKNLSNYKLTKKTNKIYTSIKEVIELDEIYNTLCEMI